MRINHNIAALNTYRQLNTANNAQSSSMEKLSSGLRINKAGDDAAGLAISEKMRGQIRGLDQASKNSQDGISLIQTAEGALNETHSILQRMRELATQAANDTNTTTDRGEIQKEMNQLTSEINRVGNTTEFNTQKLLNGGSSAGTPGTPASGTATIDSKTVTVTGESTATDITVKFAAGSATGGSTAAAWSGNVVTITMDEDVTAISASDLNTALSSASGTVPTDGGGISFSYTGDISAQSDFGTTSITVGGGSAPSGGGAGAGFSADLQIGANQDQSFTININDMRSKALGVAGVGTDASGTSVNNAAYVDTTDAKGNSNALTDVSADGTPEYALDISSHDKASAAIKVIDNAIETVSSERSKLGAYQNRLDHTINNLNTSSENLTAAESRIRDVDYALAA